MAGDTRLYVMRGPSGRTAFAVATPTGPRVVSLTGKTTDEIESDPEFGLYIHQATRVIRSEAEDFTRWRFLPKRKLTSLLERLI